jgi:hypothetical protein
MRQYVTQFWTNKEFVRSRCTSSLSPASGAALFWWFRNQLFFDLGCHANSRIRLVQYEKVVSDPEQEVEALCNFLGVKLHPVSTDGIHATSVGRNRQPLLDAQIEQDCEDLLQRLMDALPTGHALVQE